MRERLNIAVVCDCHCFVAPFGSCRNEFFNFRKSIHGRHIGVRMELNTTFPLWHQVFPFIVNDFLDILHIHGQVSREIIDFNISTNTEPRVFLDHVKFLGFFFILDPFLHRETRSIVRHLEVNQDTTRSSHLMLNIKDNSFKNQTIFLSIDLDHRSNLCLIKFRLSSCLLGLKIKDRFVLNWRRRGHLF